MIVFPDLLGDSELEEFNENDYRALGRVLDSTLAKYLKRYMENPEANKKVVEDLSNYLGDIIESYTFHYTLRDKGILDLIGKLTPETLLTTGANYITIKEQLKFLDDNKGKLLVEIPARSKTAYDEFLSTIRGVLLRMKDKSKEPTYDNLLKRIEVNKHVFYVPGAKSKPTGCNIVNSKKRQWTTCLRGLEFKEYCDSRGINYLQRRSF